MLKELIATIGIAATLGINNPSNANDGTYYQDVNITETYEYETNEVNNENDLVIGNIYKWTNYTDTNKNIYATAVLKLQRQGTALLDNMYVSNYAINNCYFNFVNNNLYLVANGTSNSASGSLNGSNFYFIYYGMHSNHVININEISASDYLGQATTTITPVDTEGLYNLGYNFLTSRIFTNAELANMNTTIFGVTLNINQWLSHTTAIAITILLLIVLIKFVYWLFKIVSGTFIWR